MTDRQLTLQEIRIDGPGLSGNEREDRSAHGVALKLRAQRKKIVITFRTLLPKGASSFTLPDYPRDEMKIEAIRNGQVVAFIFTGKAINDAATEVSANAHNDERIGEIVEPFLQIIHEVRVGR